jgi:hypothetical protein
LKITKPEDWYKVSTKELAKVMGATFLPYLLIAILKDNSIRNQYRGSLKRALQAIYPDFPWKAWKFTKVGSGFWLDAKNQREFMDSVAEELKISNFEDWYSVQRIQIEDIGGSSLIKYLF